MIEEARITEHCTVFKLNDTQFVATFVLPSETHENEWCLTARQQPKEAIGYFPTIEACQEYLETIEPR